MDVLYAVDGYFLKIVGHIENKIKRILVIEQHDSFFPCLTSSFLSFFQQALRF